MQGVDVDNDELEGIRKDVRTLRTDLGLNLESKDKTKDEKEEKETKGIKAKLNSNIEKKKVAIIAHDGKIDSSNSNSDMTLMLNGDNIIATKKEEERGVSVSTINTYFGSSGILSLSQDNLNDDNNSNKCALQSDNKYDNVNVNENENNCRNEGVTADTATQCNEDTTPLLTPTTELHENQDLELNLESKRDHSPDRFDDECEYDFNVEMFTPSILLLVDEIAALEKDILKRHTDVAAAIAVSVAATQVLIFLLLL